jgi:hypothetical protein
VKKSLIDTQKFRIRCNIQLKGQTAHINTVIKAPDWDLALDKFSDDLRKKEAHVVGNLDIIQLDDGSEG